MNLSQFSLGPRGPTNGKKLKMFCEFGPLQVKWWYHMFSSIRKEEYMEFKLSSIFQVIVVAKNIVLGSLGNQHQALFAVWYLFLKKHTNFLNQTVIVKWFLSKQYTSLNNLKERSFCLVNWAFPFVGLRGIILCGKVAQIFFAY